MVYTLLFPLQAGIGKVRGLAAAAMERIVLPLAFFAAVSAMFTTRALEHPRLVATPAQQTTRGFLLLISWRKLIGARYSNRYLTWARVHDTVSFVGKVDDTRDRGRERLGHLRKGK
jgi:hypothetical protein